MGYKQAFLMVGALLLTPLALAEQEPHPESSSGQDAGPHTHHQPDHGSGHHGGHGLTLAGKPGRPDQIDRTIVVEASDQMKFLHEEPIRVREGETIEFRVTNTGRIPHEFAIGVKHEHAEHQVMMRQNPAMAHDEPNAVTLAPGESRTLIWTFAKAEQIELACNIPGHYVAGMYSTVEVE